MKRWLILLVIALSLMLLVFGCTTKMLRLHTITATAGPGGNIVPSGEIKVAHGSYQVFHIIPDTDTDSVIQEVIVDGLSVGPVGIYAYENVTQDHTIYASFYTYPDMVGIWEGTIDPDYEDLPIEFMISNQNKGEFTALFHSEEEEGHYLEMSGSVTPYGEVEMTIFVDGEGLEFLGVVSDDFVSGTFRYYWNWTLKDEAFWHATRQ